MAADSSVQQMILEDLRQIRLSIEGYQQNERTEFRLIHDKIDDLVKSMGDEMRDQAVDIGKLQGKLQTTAWMSGGAAGIVSSAMIASIVMYIT